MLKRLFSLSLAVLLLLIAIPFAAAEETAPIVPGGMCILQGTRYLTDRYGRGVFTLVDGSPVRLIGRSSPVGGDGRVKAGARAGSFTDAALGEPWGIVPFEGGLLFSDRLSHTLYYADLQTQTVSVFAGGGQAGFRGGSGSAALFHSPAGLAADGKGNVYIADSGNHAIRIVNAEGYVRTYLGGEEGSTLGDVSHTRLSYPMGLYFADDTLYIADTGNHRILAIRDGVSTLVAGAVLSGDAAIEGDYLNGAAYQARFSSPMSIVCQDGVLYVADSGNGALRVIRDGYVTTLERGGTEDALISPDMICHDGERLWVGDSFTRRIGTLPVGAVEMQFSDVSDAQRDTVRFAVANELMNGVGGDRFDPDAPVTRAMALTVLARMDGMDTDAGKEWYTVGLQWCVDHGISDGTNAEQSVTREQLITMLYRYVGEPASMGSIAGYSDNASVSAYALPALSWAAEYGLLPSGNIISPARELSRVEAAEIIMLFLLYAQ